MITVLDSGDKYVHGLEEGFDFKGVEVILKIDSVFILIHILDVDTIHEIGEDFNWCLEGQTYPSGGVPNKKENYHRKNDDDN